jgi:hypothetical protein
VRWNAATEWNVILPPSAQNIIHAEGVRCRGCSSIKDDVRLELKESKVRFADHPETSLPVSTRALVIQRYFDPGRDKFCNCSTRCLSVITRRAEVNAAKHPPSTNSARAAGKLGKDLTTPVITSESTTEVTLYARI